jgi:ribosome biogenesis GTPase
LNEAQRKKLSTFLDGLDRNEVQKIYKRASALKRSTPAPTRRSDWEYEDDDAPLPTRTKSRGPSLDEVVLRMLEQEAPPAPQGAEGELGTVIHTALGACTLDCDGEEVGAVLSDSLRQTQQTSVAVGDEARFVRREGALPRVEAILPRRTWLARSDPSAGGRQRVIVANVDRVVVVVSVGAPPLHPRLIDRYLIAIAQGGASAVVAVNKIDLLPPGSRELDVLEPYRPLGVPIVPVSADSGMGLDALRAALGEGRCAFVGHSGVGKSSLLNALRPDLDIKVSAQKRRGGKGKHTTTASTLWDIGEGLKVIDTPGIRSFGLWKLTREEVLAHFPEFAPHPCRFRDCRHQAEPECGVRAAAESGELSPWRYGTYLRLLEEA